MLCLLMPASRSCVALDVHRQLTPTQSGGSAPSAASALDRMLIFNDFQLLHVLAEYEDPYHTHRPHRALEQHSPMAVGPPLLTRTVGVVRSKQILGGLINEYEHAA
jgi:hypothetical protein